MDKTKLYAVISTMAIYHNNQRYEQGDKLELTDEEAARISLYVQLDEAEDEKRKQAEAEAEKARKEAEAEAEKARKEAEKANKNNKGEGKE
ncbi:hypothetical protein BFQ30_05120 [Haemophilus quentini]|uniref:DUF7210 domain-containing protein n=1 Tax=Haemophilus quentini TaxID=123834 RepID=A0ABX3BQU9_9PAST|nr:MULTISPECIES: hypothetical protein [Haemophilus]DAU19642.1 MAG TPA: hypothetical protein [Caudoviricetes sp.]NYA48007.1 hypothetical protein [Haemophilus haemolyticus]OEY77169.1 hypothetical protein BFQ29_05680 [Haemophilus quentini]OEY77813.1 hypothetical protein BFQ30_05120 [Haemophilus quentini]ORC35499.1 hypothetical protein BES36_007625 [Haemophilus quentini]